MRANQYQWVAGFLLAMTMNVFAEVRVFTSSDGKKIEAETLGVKDGKATLKVGGGKSFSVPLERLSEADQKFLKEWAESNTSYGLTDLRFEAKKSRETERTKGDKKKKAEKKTEISWVGTLQNNTREAIDDIVISYTIYRRDYRKSKYGTSESIEDVEGEDKVGSIEGGAVYEFESDSVEEFTKVEKDDKDKKGSTERQSVIGAVFKVSIGGRELFRHEDPRDIVAKVEAERKRAEEREEREAERSN